MRIEFPRSRGVPRYLADKLLDPYSDLEWDYGDMATLYRELVEAALVHQPSNLFELSDRLTKIRIPHARLRRALWQLVSAGKARPTPALTPAAGKWLWRLPRRRLN